MVSSFPYPINACVTPENYPGLAHLSPNLDLLRRGEGINGVDLHKQLYQQVLQEFSKYSKCTGEPLEFQYFNGGHGERLIPLPLSRNMAGTVKPVVNKCIDELLNACNNEEENDEVFDLLFNYLHKHHDKKLKAKLRENQLTHRIMDEYNVAALLDEANIKIWQWRKINQCLRLFMDVKQVAVSEKRIRELGAGYGEITHVIYHFSDPKKPGSVKEQ